MIRTATTADIPTVLQLAEAMHAESWHSKYPFARERLTRLFHALVDGAGAILVCQRDDVIVGFVVAQVALDYCCEALMALEYGVYVTPARRGSMDGPMLVRRYIEWANERGAVYITIGIISGIYVDRTGALYEKLGFEKAGQLYVLDAR